MSEQLGIKQNVGEQIIARVNGLCEAGFTMPNDYNFVNAIKMSMLKIQDLKDKNGKSALDVCSQVSIQTALFQMVCKGLNAATNQCYFIVRGNQLCLHESYYGKVLMVKRHYPEWNPVPVVIREGDVFEYAYDKDTGKKHIVKHEQKLENMDKGFVGGYMYLPDGDLFVMTKRQILTAWSKSSSREQSVHKQFDEKMVQKTLVNSGCNMVINSTPEYQMGMDEETDLVENRLPTYDNYDEFEEVADADAGNEQAKQPNDEKVDAQPQDEEF